MDTSETNVIINYLKGHPTVAFTPTQLEILISEYYNKYPPPPKGINNISDLVDKLIESKALTNVFVGYKRKERRLVVGTPDPYKLALDLRKNSYLTHLTAAHFNGLLTREPSEIHVNAEQSTSGYNDGALEQANIDAAFKRKQRITSNSLKYGKKTIFLINGKNTEELGVITSAHSSGFSIRLTNLERNLIDLAVRPAYAGGAKAVFNIYRSAGKRVSIPLIVSMLKDLEYSYPIHQSIGFYLQKTGQFVDKELEPLKKLGLKYHFYLDYAITKMEFSEEWKLFYPANLR